MPTLAEDDDARLLWYCNLAHGSTWSYRVVTMTAVRDGAAYERLATRIQRVTCRSGCGRSTPRATTSHAKVLVPLPWSPMADLDLASVPGGGVDRDPVVYMQDTMWPYEDKFADYIEASGSVYSKSLEHRDSGAPRFLDIEAGFQPAFGSHVRREVMLMQRVLDVDRLQNLLMTDIPHAMRAPGTWMHDALALRDKWESLLLRTARWSPAPLGACADRRRWRDAVRPRDARGRRPQGRRVRDALPHRLDADARRRRRRPPALVHEPRARQRARVQRGDHHRRARRRGVGAARRAASAPATCASGCSRSTPAATT